MMKGRKKGRKLCDGQSVASGWSAWASPPEEISSLLLFTIFWLSCQSFSLFYFSFVFWVLLFLSIIRLVRIDGQLIIRDDFSDLLIDRKIEGLVDRRRIKVMVFVLLLLIEGKRCTSFIIFILIENLLPLSSLGLWTKSFSFSLLWQFSSSAVFSRSSF